MPRELPQRPSLVHLKQQAKARLDAMRRSVPAAQLADALHAVAQEYGFSTWPELKAHIERVVVTAPAPREGARPLAGRWIAEGSALHSLGVPSPAAATLDFTIVGTRVTVVQSLVEESGREERATSTFDVDGEEHRFNETGYGVKAEWTDRRTLDVSTTLHGRRIARVMYVVADDGATLSLSSMSEAHDGFPPTRHHASFSRQTFR